MNKNTFTTNITDNKILTVNLKHYMKVPKKVIPVPFILSYLDNIQEKLGWSDTNLNCCSPKCLAADIACHMNKNKIVQHFINNATIKAGLRNEKVEFIADLCCYTHCVGALMGNDICDAMWSVFNAIKLYVDKNWSKNNAIAFFQNID